MKLWVGALAGAGLAAAVAAASPAKAEELRIVIGLPGDYALVHAMQKFADQVERRTDGAYTGKVYAGSLLTFAETMSGVRDGIAAIGFVPTGYHRAEFPNSNLVVDLATATNDPVVMAGAANEFMFACKPCLAEYAAQNQVFLGLAVIGPYYLASKQKVQVPADFKGRKYRGFGPYGRWAAAMGATAVATVTANDVYEAISQGHLDGNIHTVDALKTMSLGDVTDYLLNEPVGLYNGNSMFNLNREVWDGLSAEQKRQFLLAAGEASAYATVAYYAENMAHLNNAASLGVQVIEPSPELRAASQKFRQEDLTTVAKLNREQYGIADAEAQVQELLRLVAKWETLASKVDRSDAKAVGELYNREIFSKVDPSVLD
ncbi:C4-dicarboxylate TRAP transporter substrate-binding protein [Rhodoligotrophos defluvii]|uniref:C4-dicarboxylate TRAP transporter substrate-binding protein n=1 Tax=Rhodoligotrophos defluvii TaxID=2561934 RepID=UPI0010C9BF91|nr:C4-dicarboxylate TRAP transporter substrate-binding protein [Rhodoligotrophos defluvii]